MIRTRTLMAVIGTACLAAMAGGAAPATAADAAYPVTVTDCGGRTTTYREAPSRVFALEDYSAMMLVELGLTDRMAGYTKFISDEEQSSLYEEELAKVKVVGGPEDYASKEAIVAEEPDLVVSVFHTVFNSQTLPTREGWGRLGVNTYQGLAECRIDQKPVTGFDLYFQDLRNLAAIFGVPDRAEDAIRRFQRRLDAAKAKAATLPNRTVWSYAGEDNPYPAGGYGTANAVMAAANLTNAFADIPKDYDSVSWEEVANRRPEVIWIQSSAGPGFVQEADKIESKLEADPRVADVPAVQNKAYVLVSYNIAGVENPRLAEAVEQMVDQLAELAG